MAAADILIFRIAKFYWQLGWRGSRRSSMPNFVKIGQSVAKVLRFCDFSRWQPPSSWIVEFAKFYWLTVFGGAMHMHKFHQNRFLLRRYCDFSNFKTAAAAILDFWNLKILLLIGMERVETHQRAKFRLNRSIDCEDIKIFRFLKMAAAAILNFQICEILLADSVWRAQTHNYTKFCQNRSFRCGDIAFFSKFKMAAAAILDFWNREILLVIRVQRVKTHLHAKFCQNRSIVCEDFSIFQDGGRPPYFSRLGHIWTTHSKNFWVSITLPKFGYDRCSFFIIWTFQILTRLARKCLFTPQKFGGFGQLDPQSGVQYQRKTK